MQIQLSRILCPLNSFSAILLKSKRENKRDCQSVYSFLTVGNRLFEMLIQSYLCRVCLVALLTLVRCQVQMLVDVMLIFKLQPESFVAIVTLVAVFIGVVNLLCVLVFDG